MKTTLVINGITVVMDLSAMSSTARERWIGKYGDFIQK